MIKIDLGEHDTVVISKDTYKEAKRIVDLLSLNIPLPEIIIEPTGAIGFEWYKDKGQVFTISVSGKKVITFARINNESKVHGSVAFEDTLPDVIIQHIKNLYSYKNSIDRVYQICNNLLDEDSAFNSLDKDKTIENLLSLLKEIYLNMENVSDEEITKRIRAFLTVEAVSGTLNELTPEQIKGFEEAVKRRPFFRLNESK